MSPRLSPSFVLSAVAAAFLLAEATVPVAAKDRTVRYVGQLAEPYNGAIDSRYPRDRRTRLDYWYPHWRTHVTPEYWDENTGHVVVYPQKRVGNLDPPIARYLAVPASGKARVKKKKKVRWCRCR
ncbi:MAG: hypothetical protein LBR29_05700 [Methylobacteriaceae bacterium]|jgi:hypothetical protein|nr:hypothetical protein [Methylobacteriaceae bacterium]